MNTRVDMGKAANSILPRFSGHIEHRSAEEVTADGPDDSGRWKRPWEVKGDGERVGEHSGYLTGTTYLSAVSPYTTVTSSVTSPICPSRQQDYECAVDSESLTHHFHVFSFPEEKDPSFSNPSHPFTRPTWYKLSNCNWMTLWLLIQVSRHL